MLKLTESIAFLTVGVVVILAVAVPVVGSFQYTEVDYSNEAIASEVLDLVDGNEVYVFDKTTSWRLNGEPIYTAKVYCDKGWINFSSTGVSARVSVPGSEYIHLTTYTTVTKVVLEPDKLTLTIDGTDTVISVSYCMVTNPEGQWGMLVGDVYVENLDDLRMIRDFAGDLAVLTGNTTIWRTGSWEGYLDYSEENGGIYKVNWPIVATPQWTLASVMAPLHAHAVIENDGNLNTLVQIIPLIMMLGLVVCAVTWAVNRR